jgi:hypothetical protein
VPKLRITREDEKRVAEFCGVYHRWLMRGGFRLKRVEKDFAVYQDWTECLVTLSLRRFGGWIVRQDGAKDLFGTGFDDLCKITAPVGRY